MIRDFETTVSYLLPNDLVTKRKTTEEEKDYAYISESNTNVSSSSASPQPLMRKTSVHCRRYKGTSLTHFRKHKKKSSSKTGNLSKERELRKE